MLEIIKPNWPAPKNIHAFTTTRRNGFSRNVFESFNLGLHVGDEKENVLQNRQLLNHSMVLPSEPLWLEQIHSNEIITADDYHNNITTDGCYTEKSRQVCTIMTADCLPILLTNQQGNFVMAVHAGWRGLAGGIIENAVKQAKKFNDEILVWIGPSISQDHYEVGPEVKEIFHDLQVDTTNAFRKSSTDRWLLDLSLAAKLLFNHFGIKNVYRSQDCTYKSSDLFFSYRRDGKTGRMATCIYSDDR